MLNLFKNVHFVQLHKASFKVKYLDVQTLAKNVIKYLVVDDHF